MAQNVQSEKASAGGRCQRAFNISESLHKPTLATSFNPRAVTVAAVVAAAYGTISCLLHNQLTTELLVTHYLALISSPPLRLVWLTMALKDWLTHCQKIIAPGDLDKYR